MKSKKRILGLKNREILYNLIKDYPGINEKSIMKKLNISEGTVKYHLHYLIKYRFISQKNSFGYKRYFTNEEIGVIEKELLSILQQTIPRNILLYLLIHFCQSEADLSKVFEKDKKTIRFHLNKLKKLNLIELAKFEKGMMRTNRDPVTSYFKRIPLRNEKLYRLTDPFLVWHMISKYRNNFLDDEITKKGIEWLEFLSDGPQPKVCHTEKDQIERLEKVFFDIFPFPWCA